MLAAPLKAAGSSGTRSIWLCLSPTGKARYARRFTPLCLSGPSVLAAVPGSSGTLT